MRTFRNLALALIGLLCAADAFGQNRSPAMSQLPWWDYRPERIVNDFNTIIGQSGTTLISNSPNRTWTVGNNDLSITLPFNFSFMRRNYPAGYILKAFQGGWLSFSDYNSDAQTWAYQPSTQYWSTGQTGYRNMIRSILPYWGTMETSGVSNPSGGIYWRVDGVTPNRVLTVEWRVRAAYPTATSAGNFQTKLYEKNSAIEFHYGPNNIPSGMSGPNFNVGYGALVGIYNFGQAHIQRELTAADHRNDEDNFMLFVHPDQVIRGRQPGEDTVAITRVNTIFYFNSIPYYPVWYAYFPSYDGPTPTYYLPSEWWHYNFPTEDGEPIGYRMRPILNDVRCDSVWFTPTNAINAYPSGTDVTVNAIFSNQASAVKNNIPTRFDVYYNGQAKVYTSEQRTVSPGNRLGSASVSFSPIPGTVNNGITGLYQVRIYSQDPPEEDYRNDTCKVNYFVLGDHDVLAYQILQPFENLPPLFTKYPVGLGVPIEARFLNVGVNAETNVPIKYEITRLGETTPIYQGNAVLPGTFNSATFRDYNLPTWTPTEPGTYCIRIYTNLANDEQRLNDTIPMSGTYCFTAAYEIELAVNQTQISPLIGGRYPVGRPIPVQASFTNNGITDATNTPATVTITDPRGNVVYNQTVSVSEIIASGGFATQAFPDFVPSQASGPGTYRVTVTINNPQDPITANNTFTWTFRVLSQLSGDIFVGFGERFQTIQEAADSLFYLGVSGNVKLILIDDEYTVAPQNNDLGNPAIDFRGTIVGSGPNAQITWTPHPNKTNVTIHLQSPSGIGMMFGQEDTSNPSGYMTFDGGPNRALTVDLEKTVPTQDLYVPFYFGRGSSNYTVRNVEIRPAGGAEFHCTQKLSVPAYNPAFNRFTYVDDFAQQISSGILLRNTMPFNTATGANDRFADTLLNQNNVFENNEISGFGYGIASIGAGPVMDEEASRFAEFNNRANIYRNNEITNVSRAGIAVVFESGSQIIGNEISHVYNDCSAPITNGTGTEEKGVSGSATNEQHAVGIWVSSGGNATGNRGYSTNLSIERNLVSDIRAGTGNAIGIWVEQNRNVLITPGNVVQSFPLGGSAIDVQNNMAWDYSGAVYGAGIAATVTTDNAGNDYMPINDNLENNTIYNRAITGGGQYYGIVARMGDVDVLNNIIAVLNNGAVALNYIVRTDQYEPRDLEIESDYNLFWVPSGSIGQLTRVSPEGYALPSPVVATTLPQWQYLTGLDMNSLVGNILPEFKSTSVGSEDLHLNAQRTNTLAGNRGVTIADITTDIDGEPRGQSAVAGAFDLGADEFWGTVRNNDLSPVAVVGPFGFQATTGVFSDAEYVMSDSIVDLRVDVRNLGGRPTTSAMTTLDLEYWNGSTWISETRLNRISSIDVAENETIDFGTFRPRTLAELGMTDATFGTMSVNVTPIYRFRVTTGNDDNLANNTYEKRVRFYVQRSKTESFVSVENYRPGVSGSTMPTATTADRWALANKLNADTIVSALAAINWERSGTITTTDFTYDLFERDRWPVEALNFKPWQVVMWMQGEETEGLKPEERWAIKEQQEAWDEWRLAGLFITGQEVARIHDRALDAGNGMTADREFVQTYLRARYIGPTSPAIYDNLRVQGIRITPGRFEVIRRTGVTNDLAPMPSVLRATSGEGVAQGTHWYVDHNKATTGGDTLSGMTVANLTRAAVYYGVDIRHWGRFAPEADRSGAQRVVLGALDFLDQYGAVLPVEVVSFTAKQTGREAVTVRWETSSEVDITAMAIERSEVVRATTGESLGESQEIAQRAPQGGPEKGASYAVVDQTVRGGREYEYRLVTIEKDGSRHVVDARRVLVTGGAEGAYMVEVTPNPVSTTGAIAWRAPRGEEVTITVFNALGEVVQTWTGSSDGEGSVAVDASALSSGQYTVTLLSGEQKLTTSLRVTK